MRFHFSPSVRNKWLAALQVLLLATSSALPAQDSNYVFKVQTEVVLVNVTVRDKSGNLVRNLKQDDFTVLVPGCELARGPEGPQNRAAIGLGGANR